MHREVDDIRLERLLGVVGELLQIRPELLFALAVDAAESIRDVPAERDAGLLAVVDDVEASLDLSCDDVAGGAVDGILSLVGVDVVAVLAPLKEIEEFREGGCRCVSSESGRRSSSWMLVYDLVDDNITHGPAEDGVGSGHVLRAKTTRSAAIRP